MAGPVVTSFSSISMIIAGPVVVSSANAHVVLSAISSTENRKVTDNKVIILLSFKTFTPFFLEYSIKTLFWQI
jgi:hypothetical protein